MRPESMTQSELGRRCSALAGGSWQSWTQAINRDERGTRPFTVHQRAVVAAALGRTEAATRYLRGHVAALMRLGGPADVAAALRLLAHEIDGGAL